MPQKDMLTYGNLVITLVIAIMISVRNIITVTLPKISYTIMSRTIGETGKMEKKRMSIKEYVKISNKKEIKKNDI